MEAVKVTAELLARYDRPGPRYTSYPTAPVWSEDFGPQDHAAALRRAGLRRSEPLALYVHVPYCEKLCFFCACSVVVMRDRRKGTEYVDLVLREAEIAARHIEELRSVGQHHWGGGTPTFLEPADIERLYKGLADLFPTLPDAEVSIEVHPPVTTSEQMAVLRELGFNRLSMGVQDFDPAVQETINRPQPPEQTARLIQEARRLGFLSVNVDLVYGLPRQTARGLGRTVEQVLEMGVDRIACYSYAHVPWLKKHQRVFDPAAIPGGEAKLALFLEAYRRFQQAGLVAVGMDHFARPQDELARAAAQRRLHRNFMGYTTKVSEDMVSLGVTAISEVSGAFVQNHRDLQAWSREVRAGTLPVHRGWRRTPEDEARRWVILDLMCRFRVRFAEHEARLGRPFADHFAPEMERMAEEQREGMVRLTPEGIEVTALGRLFVRNLCMHFDAYLPAVREGPLFSRTV